MARIFIRATAKRDLTHHIVYLSENGSNEIATRFRNAAEATFKSLSLMPELGTPSKINDGIFAGIRLWPISDFGRYLIAYRLRGSDVIIERIIHAAQDYGRILQ